MKPRQEIVDCDPEVDDTVILYSRQFGENRIVIVPKNVFKLDETETTYILTFKK